jgi:hypothetical protein
MGKHMSIFSSAQSQMQKQWLDEFKQHKDDACWDIVAGVQAKVLI